MPKILLSAYAFAPFRGSEPGLGWLWADVLSRKMGWDVTVLFSKKLHGEAVDRYLKEHAVSFKVIPIDFLWPGKGEDLRLKHLHYFVWLLCVGWKTRQLRKRGERFDWCQQVTWASLRYPCFLAHNGKIVMGPMGGGEVPNWKLLADVSLVERCVELLRVATVALPHALGLSRLWFGRVDYLALANPDNKWCIPKAFARKVILHPSISLHDFTIGQSKTLSTDAPLRLLFVGRLVAWKGVYLVVDALERLVRRGFNVVCCFVGKGKEAENLRAYIRKCGLDAHVELQAFVPRQQTVSFYDKHDVFVFPSMHDSGGMVVLEALSRGLPVICLAAGGPQNFVSESTGAVVPAHLTRAETVSRIADAVVELTDRKKYHAASQAAISRALDFQSDVVIPAFWKKVQAAEDGKKR